MGQEGLVSKFKEDLELRGVSKYTVKQYPLYVKAFYVFNHNELLNTTRGNLTDYLSYLKNKGLEKSSLVRYFGALNAFFEFLVFNEYMTNNPITGAFRKHYLHDYKSHDTKQRRQCITVEEARTLVLSIMDTKDLAVVLLLLKTGMRESELSSLDVSDINMEGKRIHLKSTGKRSNEVLYIDDETRYILQKWLLRREKTAPKDASALFLNKYNQRLSPKAINKIVIKHAIANGLHDPTSDRNELQKRLTPHSLRHFFTTRLIEAGLNREYVMELRGDAIHDAVDLYYNVDKKKLQKAYEDCVPQFGLM